MLAVRTGRPKGWLAGLPPPWSALSGSAAAISNAKSGEVEERKGCRRDELLEVYGVEG